MARELPRNLIIITFIGLGPAKCERRGKRGEARNKRGGSGASRTGLSGAQGQTNRQMKQQSSYGVSQNTFVVHLTLYWAYRTHLTVAKNSGKRGF